jgi:pimeloyl-ACP methyl ester carboxylesterase
MGSTKNDSLRVSGANLYYEVRGSGPILLLIHAAGGDARGFDGIAERLAEHYTLVAYDRRGLSRSQLDDPEEEQRVETQSDDAHRLLQRLGAAPAYVFGSSGGAAIGLDLAAHHPEQVHTLVAHEPPSHLLPEEEDRHASAQAAARGPGGPAAALQQFITRMGIGAFSTDREPGVELPTERPVQNTVFLMKHEFAMYDRYWLDFGALKEASTQMRLILAAGEAQREAFPYRSAAAVADRLGIALTEFPGGHVGYITHPRAFAARLLDVLGAEPGR